MGQISDFLQAIHEVQKGAPYISGKAWAKIISKYIKKWDAADIRIVTKPGTYDVVSIQCSYWENIKDTKRKYVSNVLSSEKLESLKRELSEAYVVQKVRFGKSPSSKPKNVNGHLYRGEGVIVYNMKTYHEPNYYVLSYDK